MHDLHATLLHLLGLDHEQLTYRYAGRDFRLTDVFGRPRIVRRYGLTDEEVRSLFRRLAAATRVRPSPTVPVALRDAKDEPILAAALGGDADYLVTGDEDLLVHRGDPRLGKLKIVTVAEFLAILDELRAEEGEAP